MSQGSKTEGYGEGVLNLGYCSGATLDKGGTVTLQELLVTSLAQTDAVAKGRSLRSLLSENQGGEGKLPGIASKGGQPEDLIGKRFHNERVIVLLIVLAFLGPLQTWAGDINEVTFTTCIPRSI